MCTRAYVSVHYANVCDCVRSYAFKAVPWGPGRHCWCTSMTIWGTHPLEDCNSEGREGRGRIKRERVSDYVWRGLNRRSQKGRRGAQRSQGHRSNKAADIVGELSASLKWCGAISSAAWIYNPPHLEKHAIFYGCKRSDQIMWTTILSFSRHFHPNQITDIF